MTQMLNLGAFLTLLIVSLCVRLFGIGKHIRRRHLRWMSPLVSQVRSLSKQKRYLPIDSTVDALSIPNAATLWSNVQAYARCAGIDIRRNDNDPVWGQRPVQDTGRILAAVSDPTQRWILLPEWFNTSQALYFGLHELSHILQETEKLIEAMDEEEQADRMMAEILGLYNSRFEQRIEAVTELSNYYTFEALKAPTTLSTIYLANKARRDQDGIEGFIQHIIDAEPTARALSKRMLSIALTGKDSQPLSRTLPDSLCHWSAAASPDFTIEPDGLSIFTIQPHNLAARTYLQHATKADEWFGGRLIVDQSNVSGLIDLLDEDGWLVSAGSLRNYMRFASESDYKRFVHDDNGSGPWRESARMALHSARIRQAQQRKANRRAEREAKRSLRSESGRSIDIVLVCMVALLMIAAMLVQGLSLIFG